MATIDLNSGESPSPITLDDSTVQIVIGSGGGTSGPHTHAISDVTGLSATLDDKANSAHTHTVADITDYAAPDLSNYVTSDDSRLSDSRTPSAHSHNVDDVTGLQSSLDGKASSTHNHAINDVTGLQAALDAKVDGTDSRLSDARTPTTHTHTLAQISDYSAPDLSSYATTTYVDSAVAGASGGGASASVGLPALQGTANRWYTSAAGRHDGASWRALGSNMCLSSFLSAQDMTVSKVRIWPANGSGTAEVTIGIYEYDVDTKTSGNLVAQTSTITVTSTSMISADLQSPLVMSAGSVYLIGIIERGAANYYYTACHDLYLEQHLGSSNESYALKGYDNGSRSYLHYMSDSETTLPASITPYDYFSSSHGTVSFLLYRSA